MVVSSLNVDPTACDGLSVRTTCRQGRFEIGHQIFDLGIGGCSALQKAYRTANFEIHQIEEHVQGNVARQFAVARGDPSLSFDFIRVLRRENIERSRSVQVNGAVRAGGNQTDRTVENNAASRIIRRAVRRIRLHGILSADEINLFAGADRLADANLMVGLNAHRRVVARINDLAAELRAGWIKLVLNFSARNEQALDVGILDGVDVNRTVTIPSD